MNEVDRKFVIEELYSDLTLANELGGWFEYRPPKDGSIIVEQYNNDGDIIKSYKMSVSIEEVSND